MSGSASRASCSQRKPGTRSGSATNASRKGCRSSTPTIPVAYDFSSRSSREIVYVIGIERRYNRNYVANKPLCIGFNGRPSP
jgi:hypothetical protein